MNGLQSLGNDGRMLLEGAAFVLQSPLAWAAALATCNLLPAGSARRCFVQASAVGVVAAASGWFPAPLSGGAAPAAMLVMLGLAGASGVQLAQAPAWGVIALGGVAAGWSGGMQTAGGHEAAGGGTALAAVVLVVLLGLARFQVTWPSTARTIAVGRRVVGAWIAAVGLLMIALWLKS